MYNSHQIRQPAAAAAATTAPTAAQRGAAVVQGNCYTGKPATAVPLKQRET